MRVWLLAAVLVIGLAGLAWQVRGGTKGTTPIEGPAASSESDGTGPRLPSTGVTPPVAGAASSAPLEGGTETPRRVRKTKEQDRAERMAMQLEWWLVKEEALWDFIQATPEERERAREIFVRYFWLDEALRLEKRRDGMRADEFRRRGVEISMQHQAERVAVFGQERADRLKAEDRRRTDLGLADAAKRGAQEFGVTE